MERPQMLRNAILSWALLCLIALPAKAQATAGDFDYYVFSLSWSPNWCALQGDSRGSPQCYPDADFGWVLQGLWPQYETGWPTDCRHTFHNPSRADTTAVADIMGTNGLAWHQWNKFGSCSGLSPDDYFALARAAYDRVMPPKSSTNWKTPSPYPRS